MIFKKEYTQHPLKKLLLRLRKHRGLNDLLTYAMQHDDSTIIHKDGAISRHYSYTSPDSDSATDNELDFIFESWKNSFNFLGDGWMLETNVISLPFNFYAKSREFPEIVSALIDDERRMQYQDSTYFKTTYYLSITYKPASAMQSKLKRFALGNKKSTQNQDLEDDIIAFDKKVGEFINYLSRSLINISPLKDNELTSFLHYCITGKTHKLAKPNQGCFLDTYLASEDFIGGYSPKIGKQHIKVLALDDLPAHSHPNILKALQYFPIEYRWSSRFIPLDKNTAISYLKKYERSWSSKAIGAMGVMREACGLPAKRDEDAQSVADQIKQAQMDNTSGVVGHGFYNSNLILMHQDREYLEKVADEITTKIQQMDFKVRDESVNACETFLGSLPSHGGYNLRKMLVDTNYVGHALPTSSLYQGEATSPCNKTGYKDQPPLLFTATEGDRPFLLNCHVGDVGHTAILGPTGMGKSTLIGTMMMGHRQYPGSRIIVMDKDQSNRIPIKALGGVYYDLTKNDCELAPLARLNQNDPHSIDQALSWLIALCELQNIKITPNQKQLLRNALTRLSNEKQTYKNLSHLSIQDSEIRTALNVFNTGQYQQLLNGTQPQFDNADIIGFEMSSLIQSQNKLSLAVIQAIFTELEHLFQDKRPTLLILEEAWLYLKHPLFQAKLTDWFKTLRKANVSVIFVSQDLDDIVKSEASSVIQTSCMTRIFLPNKSISESRVAEQYKAFGFNDRQCQIIKHATPKQDYYYSSEYGNRLFRLDLKDVAKAFLCVSEKKDIRVFDELCDTNKTDWVVDWLKYNQLFDWADFAQNHYFRQVAA